MAGAQATVSRRDEAKERRRVQLIEATIDSIAKRGFADTTLADVAEGAGLSRGIVNFYFKSKDQLFADTLRHLADEYRDAWRTALNAAGPLPAARLRALLMVNFDPRIFSRKKIAVWFAFWGEAKSRPAYLAMCGEKDHEYSDAIMACVRAVEAECASGHAPETIARVLDAVTSGFWLDRLTDPQPGDRADFQHDVDVLLATFFPGRFGAARDLSGRAA